MLYKYLHVIDVCTHKTIVPTITEITYLCSLIRNLINTVQQKHKQKNDNFVMREKDWFCALFYNIFQRSILAMIKKIRSE